MASATIAPGMAFFTGKKESGFVHNFSFPLVIALRCRKRGPRRTFAVMAPSQPQRAPSTAGSVKHAMTMTEKILARASERSQVGPCENVWLNVDVLMTRDVCGPGKVGIFKKEFGENAKVTSLGRLI